MPESEPLQQDTSRYRSICFLRTGFILSVRNPQWSDLWPPAYVAYVFQLDGWTLRVGCFYAFVGSDLLWRMRQRCCVLARKVLPPWR